MKYISNLDIEQESLEQLEIMRMVREKTIKWRVFRIVRSGRVMLGHLEALKKANIRFSDISKEGKSLIALRSLLENKILPELRNIVTFSGASIKEFKKQLPNLTARQILGWLERIANAPNPMEIMKQLTQEETEIISRKIHEGIERKEITMDELMKVTSIGMQRGLVPAIPTEATGVGNLGRNRRNVFRLLFERIRR